MILWEEHVQAYQSSTRKIGQIYFAFLMMADHLANQQLQGLLKGTQSTLW